MTKSICEIPAYFLSVQIKNKIRTTLEITSITNFKALSFNLNVKVPVALKLKAN